MRRAVAGALVLAACTTVTGDFGPVVAIAYSGPSEPAVVEADTVTLSAVALDASGEALPEVPVIWTIVALDTSRVPFTLDTLTGLVTGRFDGTGNVRAGADGLYTNLIAVRVFGVADSIAAIEPSTVTVDTGVTVSPLLTAVAYDVPPTGAVKPLGSQTVRFAVVQPAPGTPAASQLAIAPPGTAPGSDSLTVIVTSAANGSAAVTARRVGPVQPDTAIIEAVVLSPAGDVIPGPPARFLVLFAAT